MTITRLLETGFEFNSLARELDSYTVSSNLIISVAQKRTGSYSLGINSTAIAQFNVFTTAQIKGSFHFWHGQYTGTTTGAAILSLRSGTTEITRFAWDGTAFRLAQAANTTLTTVAHAPFAEINKWYHIAFDVKVAGAGAGWWRIWVDGVLVVDWAGTNNAAGSTFDRVVLGAPAPNWVTWSYYDDIYLDDTTGEVAPLYSPDYRYVLIRPNGNGANADWSGSDGDSINNFLLVDELPHDGDDSYLQSMVAGNRDSWLLDSASLPVGGSVVSVIPYAYSKKDLAESTSKVKIFTAVGLNENLSVALAVGTDYTKARDRQFTKPGGGAWDQTAIDGITLGVEHAT